MKRVLRPLLMLHADARLRERVRRLCAGDLSFVRVNDWDQLEESIRNGPPASMAVVDPRFGESEGGVSHRLRALLEAYPSTAVVATMRLTPNDHDTVRRLGQWGVVQVVSLGHDDTETAIGHRLSVARGWPMRALLERVLPPETSGRARVIVDAAADVVAAGEQGADLAGRLGVSRRTLLRWSQRAGIPPPRLLLAWMRILLACALLDDPGRSVLSVARTAGYASDSGLRRVTQKFLGSSPSELRESGAFEQAAKAFVAVLRDSRLKVRITTREG